MKEITFKKYDHRGAYHWDMVSKNPRKHHPVLIARYQLCLEMLDLFFGAKVLDLGCGDGVLSSMISRSAGYVVGVDSNQLAISFAQENLRKKNLDGIFHTSTDSLLDHSFDRIVCTEVIEHVSEPNKLLTEIQRLIKPEGLAVISTPIRLTETVRDKEHIYEYYPSEFENLLGNYFELLNVKKAVPAGLHELLYISGFGGRITSLFLRSLSAWLNWNYIIKLKGQFTLYELQFAVVRTRGVHVKNH